MHFNIIIVIVKVFRTKWRIQFYLRINSTTEIIVQNLATGWVLGYALCKQKNSKINKFSHSDVSTDRHDFNIVLAIFTGGDIGYFSSWKNSKNGNCGHKNKIQP